MLETIKKAEETALRDVFDAAWEDELDDWEKARGTRLLAGLTHYRIGPKPTEELEEAVRARGQRFA